MLSPSFILLYADSPEKSGAFYRELLGREPIESSPTFVMFTLDNGLMLGLWSRHTVEPAANPSGGGEIAFTVESAGKVDAMHDEWKGRGLRIAQAPTDLDFGRTFVALDPDGHRLRVFCPVREEAHT